MNTETAYEIGLSSMGKVVCEKLFRDYAESNIKNIELSQADYSGFDYKAAKKYADEYGVRFWSMHLPFAPFDEINIASPNRTLRENAYRLFTELIGRGAEIGIDKFIVHPSGEPIDGSEREEQKKYSKESLSRLADFAAQYNAVICVEDLPRTCLANTAAELNGLIAEDGRLAVCFDTNHLLTEKPEDAIRNIGSRIVTLHVSDYDFVNERHWLPGEGQINWQNLTAALRDVGYRGVWMYEIGFECPKTILRDRDLNCEDFRRNAEEVLSGKKPTVFSAPKPGLGFWE